MFIDQNGYTWYRGNMHLHTHRSDGDLSYEDAVELYRGMGYDFLAVTDHWHWSEDIKENDFLRIAGCEYDVGASVPEGIYHIVAIGCEGEPELIRKGKDLNAQQIIDQIHEHNGYAILAHPSWSLNRPDKVLQLKDIDATEIYNTFSGVPWNARPYSGDFVDILASEGMRLPCMAADDSHRYEGEAGRSYLMVKAEELSKEAILSALRRGDFIATQGPMAQIRMEGGTAVVECSPASRVVFYTDGVYSDDRCTTGEDLTRATCRIRPHETFVRAEIVDSEGRTAWTSPIPVR